MARGQEAARLPAGPCGLPTAPTAGRPPERGLLSAVIGAVLYLLFYLTLTGRVSPDVSSFFPSPDFHLLRPVVMLPVAAAATVPGIGELPGARSAAGSGFLLLSAVSTVFNSMNACSGFCPLLSAF